MKDSWNYSGYIFWTYLSHMLSCCSLTPQPQMLPSLALPEVGTPCWQLEFEHYHQAGHYSSLRHLSCQPCSTHAHCCDQDISDILTCTSGLREKPNPTQTAATQLLSDCREIHIHVEHKYRCMMPWSPIYHLIKFSFFFKRWGPGCFSFIYMNVWNTYSDVCMCVSFLNERKGWGIISKVKRRYTERESGERERVGRRKERREGKREDRNNCATLHLKCVNVPQISLLLLLYVCFYIDPIKVWLEHLFKK